MEKFKADDTFLARWIAGELTPEEYIEFKGSKEYSEFKKINEGAQSLEAPSFDRQDVFVRLQGRLGQIKNNDKTTIRLPRWVYGTAASVVIALGIFFMTDSGVSHFQTALGEQETVVLPDNSKVYLNANSELEFQKRNWNDDRVLSFDGEAFFDVEKGATFKVVSNEGIVEVLGTEFNIVSSDDFFEVSCHEGKVKVSNGENKSLTVLSQGEAFRIISMEHETWSFQRERPTWLTGESSFTNSPLKQVIKKLENQYSVVFNTDGIDVNRRFTGSFTHKDLNLALKTVFTPLRISYSQQGKTILLTLKD